MRVNQIRLWLSSVAIGAQVQVTVRKAWVSLASGSPYASLFAQVYHTLRAAPRIA